ncbi:MAG: hypothetical protein NC086_05110, partial [Alistipes sp.]|nr:hypothetical protein [Alistipes sp.]
MERMEIEKCLENLLDAVRPIEEAENVPITRCHGRILAKDVIAGMMVPPFAKSAMDGYAVRAFDVEGASGTAPVILEVAGELLAGDYKQISYEKNTAIRVMTGSYIPEGFDAVVRQEDTDYGDAKVSVYAG